MECDKLVTKCGKLVTDHGTLKTLILCGWTYFCHNWG